MKNRNVQKDVAVVEKEHLNEEMTMKYAIETLIATVEISDKEKIEQILNGDFYEIIDMSECGELVDDEETARKGFEKMQATARKQDDGRIEIRIPALNYGKEELEEEVFDGDEPFYYLPEYEEIDRRDFDEESWKLFHELGF